MTWLALDIATRTGWACSGGNGASGVIDLSAHKGHYPALGCAFQEELLGLLTVTRATHAMIERPFHRGNGTAVYLLTGLVFLAHTVCYEQGVASTEATVWDVRRAIGVPPKAKRALAKPLVLAWARKQGYQPADDNEADALALLHFATRKG